MKIYCTVGEECNIKYAINEVLDNTWAPAYVTKPLEELKESASFHVYEPTEPEKELKPGDICVIQMAFNEQNGIFLGMNERGTYGTFLIRHLHSDFKIQPLAGLSIYNIPAEKLSQKVEVIGSTKILDGIQHII